jgi:Secretion system C-terminal sorting domain
MDGYLDNSSQYPVVASMKHTISRIAPGTSGNYHEAKPLYTDRSLVDQNIVALQQSFQNLNSTVPVNASTITQAWLDKPTGLNNNECLYADDPLFSGAVQYGVTPHSSSTESKGYVHYADWLTQYAALHGSQAVANFPNKMHPNQSNQSLQRDDVGYIEVWNEQDKDWFDWPLNSLNNQEMAYFSPKEYAAISNIVYDGKDGSGTTILGHYINGSSVEEYRLGVKPFGQKLVMGGMVDIMAADITYVDEVLTLTQRNGSPIFDVLNFHHYSDNDWISVNFGSGRGYSPENDLSPTGEPFKKVLKGIRERYPTFELWLSEFGYDTYKGSPHAAIEIAPNAMGENAVSNEFETQGRWLVRSYLEIVSTGWDRAMQFTLRDDAFRPSGLFGTSGILLDKNSGFQPKISYWYILQMKNLLKNKTFSTDKHTGVNDIYSKSRTEPRVYRFDDFTNKIVSEQSVWVVWLPTENNERLPNPANANEPKFKLYFDGLTIANSSAATAEVVYMTSGDPDGVSKYWLPVHQDANGYYCELEEVIEKPIFVRVHPTGVPVQPNITCTTLQAQGVACDAIKVNWNFPVGTPVSSYAVYYYEKVDHFAPAPTSLDLSDPSWKLASDIVATSCGEITISGLNIPQDEYQIALVTTLYPSPTGDIFTVKVHEDYANGQLELVSVLGKTQFLGNLEGISKSIDVSSLESGTYYLKILVSGKRTLNRKVVVQKL